MNFTLSRGDEKMDYGKGIVVIRGGGDLATGIACILFMSGYKVVILEVEKPLAVRRAVSFSEAVYEGEITVEGIKGVLGKGLKDIYKILKEGNIPIYVDGEGLILTELKPLALVDAIMAKINIGTKKDMAPITIGVGPGFEAGKDVDLVVESKRGPSLGKVIYKGEAEDNTGIPAAVLGYTVERVLRAPCSGVVEFFYHIGDLVEEGQVIGRVENMEVVASIGGIIRGLIRNGLYVKKGFKIGDIDPRGIREYAFTISDKARAVGKGVLEAIEHLKKMKKQDKGDGCFDNRG